MELTHNAKRLGHDPLKDRIAKLSLDALINHATLAGLYVKVKMGKLVA